MNDIDKMKSDTYMVRAVVAKALEMSGSGYAKNQVTLFIDSLVNDGFCVGRSQNFKDDSTAHNSAMLSCQGCRRINLKSSTCQACSRYSGQRVDWHEQQ